MGHHHNHTHNRHHSHEKRTSWVVLLTFVTMIIEIIYGLLSGSMALLADGIHMGSHVLAIGISWLAYVLVRKANASKNFSGDSDKILSLSGYTNGLLLLVFAIFILSEAIQRIFHPHEILYQQAIIVAIIGLIVNIISAILLHHDEEHSDHNIKAAYLHVIADALTSVAAIAGLFAAKLWGISYVDTAAAIISSLVIIKWSIGLLRTSTLSIIDQEDTK